MKRILIIFIWIYTIKKMSNSIFFFFFQKKRKKDFHKKFTNLQNIKIIKSVQMFFLQKLKFIYNSIISFLESQAPIKNDRVKNESK